MSEPMLPDSQLATIIQSYGNGRDVANQMIGQIKALDGLSKLVTVASLQKLQHFKERKLYKDLRGQTFTLQNGEVVTVSTWDDACAVIGLSRRHIDEQLANLQVIGAEALDAMQSMNIGYREMRKLRQLPDDDRDTVIQEVDLNVGDKEAIVDLIDDMAAKHHREKSTLEKQLADSVADGEAKERLNADKNSKIDELDAANHALRSRSKPWPQRVLSISIEVNEQRGLALQAVERLDALRNSILTEDFGDLSSDDDAIGMMARTYYDGIADLVERVAALSDQCESVFQGYYLERQPLASLWDQLRDRHPDLFGDGENSL